jgi:hypothetical protein
VKNPNISFYVTLVLEEGAMVVVVEVAGVRGKFVCVALMNLASCLSRSGDSHSGATSSSMRMLRIRTSLPAYLAVQVKIALANDSSHYYHSEGRRVGNNGSS